MKKRIIVAIIIGLLALASYTAGYQFGNYLGNDLTNIVEQNRAEGL